MNWVPWPVLLVWLATAIGAALLAYSGFRQGRAMALVGWVLVAPMFFYLALTPRLFLFAPSAYALLGVYAWRIRTSGLISNIILVLPAVALLAWVMIIAASESQHPVIIV